MNANVEGGFEQPSGIQDAPFRAMDTRAAVLRQAAPATPFLSQTDTKAAQQRTSNQQSAFAVDPTSLLPVSGLDKEEDEEEDFDIAVEMEVTNLNEAKIQLEELQQKTVELANKWHQAKMQLQKQEAKEAEVRELIADAEAEIERLRNRIPKEYDTRGVEGSEIDFQNLSTRPNEGSVTMSFKKPKKGILGMEVQLCGDFVQVLRLTANGACQQAGLLEADVIRTWNGKMIASQNDFIRATSVCGAGIPLNVEVQREGVRGLLLFEVIPKRKA